MTADTPQDETSDPPLDPDLNDGSPASGDGRRRQRRGDERRQRILDEAVLYFATNGYRSSGITGLADRLQMTHPGLLYYFGTKDRLLLETVAARVHAERAAFPAIVQTATFDTLVDVVRWNVTAAHLVRLYSVLAAESFEDDAPLHDFFVERFRHLRLIISGVVERGQARGELDPDVDPGRVARDLLALVLGMETQWLMEPTAFDLDAAIAAHIDDLRARLEAGAP